MKRYFNDEPDDEQEPFFDGDDDEGDDGENVIIDIDAEMMDYDLTRIELNQMLISKAIEIAQKSWFWRFKKSSTKTQEIEKIYHTLNRLVTDGIYDEEV